MPLSGSSKQNQDAGLYTGTNFERLTVGSTVRSLTAGQYTSGEFLAKRAFITVSSASLRYKYNNEDPTASIGHIAHPNSVITLLGSTNIKQFRAIRTGTTSSVLDITYEF